MWLPRGYYYHEKIKILLLILYLKLHDVHIWYMGLLGQYDFLVFVVAKGTLLPWQQYLILYQVSQKSIHPQC